MVVSASGQSDERVRNMERILSHFLGDVSLDGPNVQRIAEKINDRSFAEEQPVDLTIDKESFTVKALSSNTARTPILSNPWWCFLLTINQIIQESSRIGTFLKGSDGLSMRTPTSTPMCRSGFEWTL